MIFHGLGGQGRGGNENNFFTFGFWFLVGFLNNVVKTVCMFLAFYLDLLHRYLFKRLVGLSLKKKHNNLFFREPLISD